MQSRSACTPRTPRTAGSPRRACCTGSRWTAHQGCAWMPESRPVPRSACTTTRCSPRSSPGRRPGVKPPGRWPARWAGRFPSGWRNVRALPRVVEYAGGIRVEYDARAHDAAPDHVVLDVDGVRRRYDIHRVDDVSYVDGPDGSVALTELPRFPPPASGEAAGSLGAPLPGAVGRIAVTPGQRVAAGDLLLTLEAMKLEHPVLAPTAGVVADLPVAAGAQVETGAVLAVITAD